MGDKDIITREAHMKTLTTPTLGQTTPILYDQGNVAKRFSVKEQTVCQVELIWQLYILMFISSYQS